MTLEDAKGYVRVDGNEDDTYILDLIEISLIYIESCVGTAYQNNPKDVKLANLLQKKLISDMYENRSTKVANNTKTDPIVTTILDKLGNCEGAII